jgi:hypothetical protein
MFSFASSADDKSVDNHSMRPLSPELLLQLRTAVEQIELSPLMADGWGWDSFTVAVGTGPVGYPRLRTISHTDPRVQYLCESKWGETIPVVHHDFGERLEYTNLVTVVIKISTAAFAPAELVDAYFGDREPPLPGAEHRQEGWTLEAATAYWQNHAYEYRAVGAHTKADRPHWAI